MTPTVPPSHGGVIGSPADVVSSSTPTGDHDPIRIERLVSFVMLQFGVTRDVAADMLSAQCALYGLQKSDAGQP